MTNLAATVAGARRDLEAGRVDAAVLAGLYGTYARVPDPDVFVSEALSMFPALCCGLASVYLQRTLGTGTLVRGQFGGENHTVLEIVELGVIIDVTADQFGGPPIYVGPWVAPWERVASPAFVSDQLEGWVADH